MPKGAEDPIAKFNRTLGLEFNLRSEDNQWSGKTFFIKTFSPSKLKENTILAGNLERRTRNWQYSLQMESVGEGVEANEVGYVQRKNYLFLNPGINYLFYPKKGPILTHGPGTMFRQYFSQGNYKSFEYLSFINYNITFKNRSTLMFWKSLDFVRLQDSFDPTNTNSEKIAGGTEHKWHAFGTNFVSKPQSLFTYAFSSRMGGYYAGGERVSLEGEMGYRFQPFVAILMRANYNRITFTTNALLPKGLENREYNLWLFGPRIDVTLSNKLFFTNFLQYNQQSNNVNLNTRLQWRYSPASDLFLVYTDNYYAENFNVRTRSIVMKFTYWFNP